MQGAPRRSARSFFVLPLVLALLALVVFPVFARAGEIPEYEVEIPTVENEVAPPHPKKHKTHQGEEPNSKAHASANPGSNSESEESEGSNNGGAAGNGNGNNGTGQSEGGSPSNGESGKPNTGGTGGVSELKEVEPAQATGKNGSESSGGGSSPVLPILIAVVVLAAISIGVVLYRQKQQSGNGPDGGRKPGQGSDGPVSSPNAS